MEIPALIEALQQDPCPNRSSLFLTLCERFWGEIESKPDLAQHAADFADLLKRDGNLLLASYVIPDLRPGAGLPAHKIKADILISLGPEREALNPAPDAPSDPLYEAERAVLRDVSVHRLWIHMCNRYEMDGDRQQQLRAWLDACPIKDMLGDQVESDG